MSIVILLLPKVQRHNQSRPPTCPYGQGATVQRWGMVHKHVQDPHLCSVTLPFQVLLSCPAQTQRLRKLAPQD